MGKRVHAKYNILDVLLFNHIQVYFILKHRKLVASLLVSREGYGVQENSLKPTPDIC